MSDTMRKISRTDFTSRNGNTIEAINAGSLQRIADAQELMAKNHSDLVGERDRAKANAAYWRQQADLSAGSIRALKGVVTKLKKQLAAARAQQEGK